MHMKSIMLLNKGENHMNNFRKYILLFKNDMRNIFRDKILMVMFIFPIIFILIFRWFAATINGIDPYLPLMLGFCYIMMPNMLGAVLGFLILDEKDDKVLGALRVMPISAGGFLLYRTLFPMGFVFIINLILPYALDFVDLDIGTAIVLAVIGAIEAPFLGLVVSSKAANKVEGMATFKFAGFAFMIPLALMFISSDWYWLLGILPTFWPIKIVLDSVIGQPAAWIYVVGLIYNLFILFIVGWFFKKTALESTK